MALIKCPDCGREVSSEASVCPGCACPMREAHAPPSRQKSSIGRGILATAILVGAIWWLSGIGDEGSTSTPAQAKPIPVQSRADLAKAVASHDHGAGEGKPIQQTLPAPQPIPKTTIDIDVGSLYRMYAANEVAADDKLAGHPIKVNGIVSSVEKSFTNSAMIYFAVPGDDFDEVSATLRDSEKSKAARIAIGQTVTVTCENFRLIMHSPMGHNCTID